MPKQSKGNPQKSLEEKPLWLKISETELKKIIEELEKAGEQPAKIGLILRDQYGIPTAKIYGKKLSEYLKEKTGVELNNIEKKMERLKNHFEKNQTDKKAKHKIQKTQSKISKLKRYFSKKRI